MTPGSARFDWAAPVLDPGELGRVHASPIGGAGVSAVARLLAARGVPVSGCDASDGPLQERLRGEGFTVLVGHKAGHLDGCDTFVVGSGIREANPELVAARRAGRRVLHRSQGLASAMRGQRLIAVAGANGKTTTTAMLTTALIHAGLDPSYAIGGELVGSGTNAHLGGGGVAVVEADESDGSFVVYRPEVAIVTSVQPDHLDHFGTFDGVKRGYQEFAESLAPGGLLVVAADDPGAAELGRWAADRGRRVRSYGTDPGADWRIVDLAATGMQSAAQVVGPGGATYRLRIQAPGWYTVHNAAAALAAAVDGIGALAELVLAGLGQFQGTRRRFEVRGMAAGIEVVDDYAHNAAKVAAVVDAGRAVAGGDRRLVVCFQPHLFSRTRDFAAEFGAALARADVAVVLDVYGAREDPIPGVSGRLVADAALAAGGPAQVHYVDDRTQAASFLAQVCRPGDLVLTVGAGDVTTVGPQLLDLLLKTNPEVKVDS